MSLKEHTVALCATCRSAIYVWFDWSMVPVGEHDDWSEAVDAHWTHFRRPQDGHDAMPLPSIRHRVLLCADCRQPQTFHHRDGWHCDNEHCEGSAGQHP